MLRENDLVDTDLASELLRDRLQKGPIGQKEALLILAQIGQALHAAHQQHLVHGHVTPERILFNTRNEAMLTDFSPHTLLPPEKIEESVSAEEAVYRAPEQLAGHTSEESDQYSLGCIAYELFTGCKVFRVPSVSAPGLYYKTRILIAPGKLHPGISSSIEEAILKALSREPVRRHRDIPAFLTALGIASATGNEDQGQAIIEATPITLDLLREALEALETIKMAIVPGYEAGRTPALPQKKAGKRLTSRRQRILILVACLVVAAIVANSLFLAFKFSIPPKRARTVPSTSATSLTEFPAQNGTSVPTVTKPVPSTSVAGRVPPHHGNGSPTPTNPPVPVSTPTPTQTPAPVAMQVPLASFFNNNGIGRTPGQANFDGSGYSYPADQVPASGLITVDGVSYQFPGIAPLANNNIAASNQTIPLPAGHYRQMFLLAAASWGPVSGTMAIRYADGSTTMIRVTVLDWITGSSNALQTTYRYNPFGIDANPAYIYVMAVTLDATRTTNALVLPGLLNGPHQNGQMHVFAVTLQP